jgi:hypothetical protein
MQLPASIDGRIALGPELTMFDTHPASDALPEEGALWARVTDAIREAFGIPLLCGDGDRASAESGD